MNRPRRRDLIFDWICDYKREHNGNSPTLREIGEAFGLTVDGARSHVNWLIIDGRLEKHGRSFIVPLSEWELISPP